MKRGNNIGRLFEDISFRPNMEFKQGTVNISVADVFEFDSTEMATNTVREFAINPNFELHWMTKSLKLIKWWFGLQGTSRYWMSQVQWLVSSLTQIQGQLQLVN